MKTYKIIFYILMFLPLAVTFIALFFLPNEIPAHLGLNGAVDRYGSKFEALILPVVTIPFGYFLLAMGTWSAKNDTNKNNNNEKIAIITGCLALLVFNVLTFYFLYAGFNGLEYFHLQ